MAEEKKVANGMNMARTGKRVVVIGVVGGAYLIASDQVVDGWFQDSAGMDSSKYAPYYRALVQGGGGLALGAVSWKYSRDVAMGFMAGGGVGAALRVAEELDVSKKLRDLVDGDGDGTRRTTRRFVAPAAPAAPAPTTPRAGNRLADVSSIHDASGWATVDDVSRVARR